MNELEGTEDVRGELQTLRNLMAVGLVMLIGLSICGDYFLSKQIRLQNAESEQFQAIIDSFPQAAAVDFVKRLQDYSKTHPDFATIKAKYPNLFNAPLTAPAAKK
jgi:hypothetical protein